MAAAIDPTPRSPSQNLTSVDERTLIMAKDPSLPGSVRGAECTSAADWASTIACFCPFLSGLPEPLLRTMGRRRRTRRFRRGDLLVRGGDPAPGILVVTEGLLKETVPGYERAGPSRILQRGDLCCEMALFGDMAMTSDVRALSDGTLLILDGRDVKEAVRACADFAGRVIRHVCGQTRQFELKVRIDNSHPAAARLARQILILSSMQDSQAARMSQDALADLVGVSRETVNRVLQQWKQAGLVDVAHGRVVPRKAFWSQEIVSRGVAMPASVAASLAQSEC